MFTVSKNAKKKLILSQVSKKRSGNIFHMANLVAAWLDHPQLDFPTRLGFLLAKKKTEEANLIFLVLFM